jgi:hypothetical protein
MTKRKYPKNKDRIYVNTQDIALGIPKDTDLCPIAHAMKRKFSFHNIVVGTLTIEMGNRLYKLGRKGRQFILDFDYQQRPVKPCHISFHRV